MATNAPGFASLRPTPFVQPPTGRKSYSDGVHLSLLQTPVQPAIYPAPLGSYRQFHRHRLLPRPAAVVCLRKSPSPLPSLPPLPPPRPAHWSPSLLLSTCGWMAALPALGLLLFEGTCSFCLLCSLYQLSTSLSSPLLCFYFFGSLVCTLHLRSKVSCSLQSCLVFNFI